MILLIDKPKGITSFDCIRILRKKLSVRKMGHAGTLDPMATGLMIIGVGEGTKMLGQYLKLPKTYEAEILLGVRTDTGDVTGRVIQDAGFKIQELEKISKEDVEKTLKEMVGKLLLPVPAYSAIKRGGEALYKKARRGEVVDTPMKTMEVTNCELLATKDSRYTIQDSRIHEGTGELYTVVSVRFDVASGTYIRSLAEEFGRRLGVSATLAGLRRTRIGEFKIEDAQRLVRE